jgi:hypothetical protein
VPTDGVVYDPELVHCGALDPELGQAAAVRQDRDQAVAQKAGLQVQLMALEVQRRQALLAAGTLTPFDPLPAETIAPGLCWRATLSDQRIPFDRMLL